MAQEIGHTGDTRHFAKLNFWLNQQVMPPIAKNGGELPA